MSTWAIIPVKRLSEAKSSLGSALVPERRREFVLCMLADVLEALGEAPLGGVVVVSPDEEVLGFASRHGASGLKEPGLGLNGAIKFATRHVVARGADSVLILPADVPMIKPLDIENILGMTSATRAVVLAPSEENGTNALFLRPPDLMGTRFGGESFPLHLAEVSLAGVAPHIYRSKTVETDIDEVADFAHIEAHGVGTRSRDFLRSLSLLPSH